jgi:hypothetical protein
MRVLLLQMMYLSYYFNIGNFSFFSLPTYKPKPNEPFLKHSYTSILKGNGAKTQNFIIYKWADAHVQNVLYFKATKMDI